jgi:hypothetical protein
VGSDMVGNQFFVYTHEDGKQRREVKYADNLGAPESLHIHWYVLHININMDMD